MIDCLMLLSAYPSVSILQVDFFLPQEISQSGSFVAPEEMREFLTDLDDTAEGGIATSLQLLTQILFTQKKICTHPSLVHKMANRSGDEAIYYHICTAQPPLATCLGLSELSLPPNITILYQAAPKFHNFVSFLSATEISCLPIFLDFGPIFDGFFKGSPTPMPSPR